MLPLSPTPPALCPCSCLLGRPPERSSCRAGSLQAGSCRGSGGRLFCVFLGSILHGEWGGGPLASKPQGGCVKPDQATFHCNPDHFSRCPPCLLRMGNAFAFLHTQLWWPAGWLLIPFSLPSLSVAAGDVAVRGS